MTSPRHIAPGRATPVIAPATNQPPPPLKSEHATPPAVASTDVIFVNGQAFNGRGYPVCGVANQRGRLCGRIGTCPFHAHNKSSANSTPKRPRSSNTPASSATVSKSNAPDAVAPSKRHKSHATVRQMAMPPQKARFKRSWTTDEHRLFLQAMRLHGKGKWKEIATEVKTRTANQCQSHAQKYFLRQAKSDSERKKKSIHDVTEKDVLDASWNCANISQMSTQQRQISVASNMSASSAAAGAGAVVGSVGDGATGSTAASSGGAVPLAPRRTDGKGGVKVETNGLGTTWNGQTTAGLTMSIPANARILPNGGQLMHNGQAISTVPFVVPMSNLGFQYGPMMQQFIAQPGGGTSAAAAAAAAVVAGPPPMAKLRVTVHVNGMLKGGMALMLPNTLEQFYEMAKRKLQFEGELFRRVFTRSGGEISCLDEMCQDDMLWLSTGEDFVTPR